MYKIIIFGVVSVFIFAVSFKQLKKLTSHGFYRFFVFELIVILFLFNVDYWFTDPFKIQQIISWVLLIASLYPVTAGYYLLITLGKPGNHILSETDYQFEKTTHLVTVGIYDYIRHPMYASLLYLCWGIYLKQISLITTLLVFVISIFLFLTAKVEEKENIKKFGDEYLSYIKRSKMFAPFIY